MKLENLDTVIFENDSVGMYREDDTGSYFTFGSIEEGYKPDYHNDMIVAYIRNGKYHTLSKQERVALVVDGIKTSINSILANTCDTELIDKLNIILADSDKINQILDSGVKY